DKPVFTPSRLVVKYGDPASVKCSVCQNCQSNFGLEIPVGNQNRHGTLISWTVDHLTEWGLSPMCYYAAEGDQQCCSSLKVTLYKPPDNVGLNIKGNSWVMSEGQNITLKCSVQNVAPAENLRVTFYSGHRQLGQKQSNSRALKPVAETFELDFTPTKEDDGGEFWCEAELLLGPDGPQPPPVVKSRNFPATVLCESDSKINTPQQLFPTVLTEGNPLQLNCSAVGNPSPTYTWTGPSGVSPTKSSILIIDSTTTEDKGQYTCFVHNNQGNVTVKFDVDLPDNVGLNITGNSWVMSEGQNIILKCSVQNVAPVENLRVTFYSGQRQIGQKQSNSRAFRPVSETFELDFSPTKEDDGGEFWCEAELLLGPDGPQPPPVVKSQNFPATVFCESDRKITVTPFGNPLQLNCSTVGNPSPTYTWTGPSGVSPTKTSVLIINSTTTEDKGQYTCFVSNNQGNITVKFDVDFKREFEVLSCPVFYCYWKESHLTTRGGEKNR
uniref:Ig-like domain-containing protein n=1 Tax=Sparus aurata TaxID=8175 RepID=A0A671TS80_SPAAU